MTTTSPEQPVRLTDLEEATRLIQLGVTDRGHLVTTSFRQTPRERTTLAELKQQGLIALYDQYPYLQTMPETGEREQFECKRWVLTPKCGRFIRNSNA